MGIKEAKSAYYYTRGRRADLVAQGNREYFSPDSGVNGSEEEMLSLADEIHSSNLKPWVQGVRAFVGLRTTHVGLDPSLLQKYIDILAPRENGDGEMTFSERSMDLLVILCLDFANLSTSAGNSVRSILDRKGKEEFDDDIHSEHTDLLGKKK